MNLIKLLRAVSFIISSILSRRPLEKIMSSSSSSSSSLSASSSSSSSSSSSLYNIDLYLIRHGETIANRDNILQGHCDYPLTEKGLFEGKCVGIALNDINWYKIYCSDLKRASDTCSLLLSHSQHNIDNNRIEYTELLREISFGVREALPKDTTVDEAKVIVAKKLGIALADVVDTAENIDTVKARQQLFIDNLKELSLQDDNRNNILIVSHGAYIKAFLRDFCLITDMDKIKNCSISKVRLKINKLDKTVIFECDRNDLNKDQHIQRIESV